MLRQFMKAQSLKSFSTSAALANLVSFGLQICDSFGDSARKIVTLFSIKLYPWMEVKELKRHISLSGKFLKIASCSSPAVKVAQDVQSLN